MKNIFIALAIMAMPFFVKAQGKPSREATVKFIENNLKKFIGNNEDGDVFSITDVSFDGETLVKKSVSSGEVSIDTYTGLHWDGLSIGKSEEPEIGSFGIITLHFDAPFTQHMSYLNKTRTFSWVNLYVPFDKLESIEKAFLRLKEIYEEENKDPFEN